MEHAQRLQTTDIPELGKIKVAVERVARARSDIECFLGRFNGASVCAGAGGTEGPEPESYRNDLTSLFGQIERLEKIVHALGEIG